MVFKCLLQCCPTFLTLQATHKTNHEAGATPVNSKATTKMFKTL